MKIKINSKKVKPGDTFVAIKGDNYDGHNFINEAINNGASKIICEHGNYDINYQIEKNTKEYLKEYLTNTYYEDIKDIVLIGITGTNGKTTSCYIIYELLKLFNVKCAYIGTVGFYIDDKICDLDNTTPELIDLYDMLLKCKEENVKVVVMEVSSHALILDRVYGLKYDYAVFTNLTNDHLNFHNTMDNYMKSKRKLFDMLKDNGITISNVDDEYSSNFILDNTVTYGMNDSAFKILNYKLYEDKTIYKFKYNNKKYKVVVYAPGVYNIYNSIISIIILNNMGYSIKSIINNMKYISLPSGRMNLIKYMDSNIYIDYAHTPDAVKKTIENAKSFSKANIYTIVGCGGNRDSSKRSEMGSIASELSDYVIFTSDNPRNEDKDKILNDMTEHLVTSNYEIISDRKLAIRRGIDLLDDSDILLILGKGHEEYQIINDVKYHFSDKEEVYRYIRNK